MSTIAIIGAGDVGAATAHALAAGDVVRRVLLVDSAAKVAAGKALDIQQAGAVAGFHTRLEGTDDLTRVTGCVACVLADRYGSASSEWNGEDALAMLSGLMPALSGAPLVMAGASQAALLETAARELTVDRRRILGSAPEAFASGVKAMVALEAGCSQSEVSLAVLGKPPNRMVVPWNDATIGGHSIGHRLDPVQMNRIEARVARLWPPGPYALGLAASRVVAAIVTSARRAYSVFAVLDGAFGVRHGAGVFQAVLAPQGIVRSVDPSLTSRERVQVMAALGDGVPEIRS